MARPKILVPLQLFKLNPRSELRLASARDTYLKKFERYELVPLFVSPFLPDEAVNQLYAECSGIFLMGGSDIDPALYGRPRHPLTEVTEPERDRIEMLVLKRALKEKTLPVLGICRGCQALCVAAGGKLIQHLPDAVSDETHDVEFYHELLTAPMHAVTIEQGTKLFSIVGQAEALVNSAHHQAVEAAGPILRISARSEAGVAEAVEHIDPDFFCLAVQSHPEAEENGMLEGVFRAFAAEVNKAEMKKAEAKKKRSSAADTVLK